MTQIIEYKWIILLTCEALAWLFLVGMLVFRYIYQQKMLFWISTSCSVFFGYVPHLTIPILMSIQEKSVWALVENKGDFLFVLFIVLLLIFGLTLGKKYVVAMDQWILSKANKQLKD